jgi:periplasmic protein TonB
MFEYKTLTPKVDDRFVSEAELRSAREPKQRRMMLAALALLLIALGFVIYRDRDFWFPDTEEAQDQLQPAPAASAPAVARATTTTIAKQPAAALTKARTSKKVHNLKTQNSTVPTKVPGPPPTSTASAAAPSTPEASSLSATTTRTVLPPLEVEVVAGDTHRTIRPGTNSVHVDLQPGSPAQPVIDPAVTSSTPATTASVTSNAAEHVQMSADTAEVVSRSVTPGYPMLARQMKVQGSVILQALIGRDGAIQDLHVLSGPPILAAAAREAVRQWRFKPHYLGEEAVETQAKITVNFTISTN